jgi:DNA recombination protein RmuC
VDIFISILSALIGAALVFLWRRSLEARNLEKVSQLETSLQKAEQEAITLRTETNRLLTESAQLAAQLEFEKQAHERLSNEFKALASDALKANSQAFMDQAKLAFESLQKQSIGDLDLRKQAVDNLVKPIKESLDNVDKKIQEIDKNREKHFGALEQQLSNLANAQNLLQTEATKLSTVLRSNSYTGNWGELQLRRVAEMADMLSYCDFSEQEGSGSNRPDMIVRLPGDRRIAVDAKTPIQSYRASTETNDEAEKNNHLKEHAKKVKTHIDSLSAKSYWENLQPAPEFVVLFLPGDHLLAAALQADPEIIDKALKQRVLLATPITLIALLKAAAYGWRQEVVSKNTEEISNLGRQLYDRVVTFTDSLSKIGAALETATKSYNMTIGSYEQNLLPGTRKLAELGAKGSKELNEPERVDTNLREIVKRS